MVVFLRSILRHWAPEVPAVQADEVVRVLQPAVEAWLRWRGLVGDAVVVYVLWRMATGG